MQVKVNIKQMIIEEEKLYKTILKKQEKALKRSGGLIRTAVRRSMRKPGKSARIAKQSGEWDTVRNRARTGKPPLRWMHMRKGGGLYRTMLFLLNDRKDNVVIGPVGFGGGGMGGPVPAQVERGGVRMMKNHRRRRRKIGDGGELRVSTSRSIPKRGRPHRTQKVTTSRFGNRRYVSYGTIRTQQQAHRANRLNKLLYGPKEQRIKAKSHEYMGPVINNLMTKRKVAGFFGDN